MASSTMSLKLLVDKKEQRVLFAEAGKDFVDFLFSLLALPVATVIRLLHNKNIEGGITKLYKSVSDLNDDYIQSNQNKDAILKPKFTLPFSSPQLPLLSTESFSSPSPGSSAVFDKCTYCSSSIIFSISAGISCPMCRRSMNSAVDAKGGGFVKEMVTYMVTDDLTVSPMSTIATITLLNKFNIKDFSALQEKVVTIRMNEGLELLKHSLNSNTVLTDVFLGGVVVKDENPKKV